MVKSTRDLKMEDLTFNLQPYESYLISVEFNFMIRGVPAVGNEFSFQRETSIDLFITTATHNELSIRHLPIGTAATSVTTTYMLREPEELARIFE